MMPYESRIEDIIMSKIPTQVLGIEAKGMEP